MKDKELIQLLQIKNNSERNRGFEFLVNRDFSAVKRYVIRNSGSLEDAKDVFQEGLIILMRNISEDRFRGKSSLRSYLISICKNHWLSELRKRKKEMPLETDVIAEDNINEKVVLESQLELMRSKFRLLGEECQKILVQFYYQRLSMNDIRDFYSLGSAQAAKNKKSRCMKKLIELVDASNER